MAIAQPKRVKVNQLVILLSGLVILAAGALIFLFILQNVYGRYQLSEIIPTAKNLDIYTSPQKYTVAILYSKYTQNMLPEGSTWIEDNISTWKTFLDQGKTKYDIISDQTIESGKHKKYNLLILPGSKSLSDKEISEIKKFVEKGGSVFATSGTASYSDDGKWRGWEFFSEVFGLKFSKEIKPDEFSKIHTLRGNLPITAGIPTGYPLKIATWDRPISCEVLEPRTTQVSFWYNFRIEKGLVTEEIQKSAGIVYGKYGRGRFIWFGFELNSVLGEQEDYIFFDRLFRNSISWLTYIPTALIKDWPEPYKAAAIITPTLSSNIYNVKNLLPILKSEDVPVTFFVEPITAGDNKGLTQSLAGYGEVAPIVDIGYLESVDDTINDLYDYNTQYTRFRQAKYGLEKIQDVKSRGAIPAYGLYDENSLNALINSDYDFIFTDSLTDRSVPRTIIRGDKRIVSFTKTARDDYEVIRNYGLTENNFQLYTYKEDVDRLLFEGGLYIFKIHTEYQCQPQYVNVVRDLIKYIKSKNIWLTSASEIKNWWLTKTHLEIHTDAISNRRINVELSNPGKDEVVDLIVLVNINKDVKNISISSDIFGTKIPKYYFNKEKQYIKMLIKSMKPGETLSYSIDFDEVNT